MRGKKSLDETHPALAAEWHPTKNGELAPQQVTPGSNKKVWWRKKCVTGEPAHEWQARINGRSQGNGCSVCVGKTVQAGVNDLATIDPALAAEWHPTKNGELTPKQVTISSGTKVWWHKKCVTREPAHEWQATISHRSQGRGCSVCHGLTVQTGVNDLATIDPALAAEWHPTKNGELAPQQVTPGTNKKVWWRKKCVTGEPAHEWQATISSRSLGTGCSVCEGLTVQTGANDLATIDPALAAEWHPTKNGELTPKQVTFSSNKNVWWRKKCVTGEPAHEWQAAISNRSLGTGCPECAGYGFNPSQDAWLYLVRHPKWKMYQIGISNVPDARLGKHRSNGWEEVGLTEPMPGSNAVDLERRLLRAIEERGGELGVLTSKGRFDGYTESWPIKSLRVRSFDQLLQWAEPLLEL